MPKLLVIEYVNPAIVCTCFHLTFPYYPFISLYIIESVPFLFLKKKVNNAKVKTTFHYHRIVAVMQRFNYSEEQLCKKNTTIRFLIRPMSVLFYYPKSTLIMGKCRLLYCPLFYTSLSIVLLILFSRLCLSKIVIIGIITRDTVKATSSVQLNGCLSIFQISCWYLDTGLLVPTKYSYRSFYLVYV